MIKFLKKIIIISIIIGLIILSYFAYKGYRMYENALEENPIEVVVDNIKKKENYTSLEQMPKIYKDAVIAVEDHRFLDNKCGFDLISITRAVVNNVRFRKLKEGGSTITQQLAKNTYFTQDKKIERKFAEIFMANKFEKELEKDEIFELYLNTCFFGNNYYTPQEASIGYFNKDISQLTDNEATLLAGIPNAPSVYNPKVNITLSKQRQRQVLGKMVKYKYLTQDRANEIIEESNSVFVEKD